MHYKEFIQKIEEELILSNVYFHLPKKEQVRIGKTGLWVSGFFQGHDQLELAVATKKPETEWFPILVHEYAHFQQYKTQAPCWVAYQSQNQTEDKLTKWLNHEVEYSAAELDLIFTTLINVEKDAEDRTIALIKQYHLPVDVEQYTKGARAYLLFYLWVKKHRRWSRSGHESYAVPQILQYMASSLDNLVLDDKLDQIFSEYL
jgi:hypothetical protein